MTGNPHVDELNRAADRLAEVTIQLSQVLERLVERQRVWAQSEDVAREQPEPKKVPLFSGGKDREIAERIEEAPGAGRGTRMVEKPRLKPSSKREGNPREWARTAREINDRLAAQGRYFGDSTEIIRADRDSRVRVTRE